jgi:hypothetical protein
MCFPFCKIDNNTFRLNDIIPIKSQSKGHNPNHPQYETHVEVLRNVFLIDLEGVCEGGYIVCDLQIFIPTLNTM